MAHDTQASSRVAADWLREHPVSGPVLTVDDAGSITDCLVAQGLKATAWQREARAGAPASAWVPEGPFAHAVVKLPKGREAQRMVLHAVVGQLADDGSCLIHGHNEEGIKSASKPAGEVFSEVMAVDARRHCRLWSCTKRIPSDATGIDAWATEVRGTLPDGEIAWTSWPGLFAHGRLDAGTELLLSALAPIKPGSAVLDFACGTGVIAKALLRRNPGLKLDLLDLDALAMHAARVNVPEHQASFLSDAWVNVPPERRWDVIVSNPPWHAGVATDWTALHDLIRQSPGRLNAGGQLWLVTQRNVKVREALQDGFSKVRTAASTPGFRVWHATR